MDPKDLLLTNQFISPDNIPNITINRAGEPKLTKEYAELTDFIKETFADDINPLQVEEDNFLSDEEDNYDLLEPPVNQPRLTSVLNRPQWLDNNESVALSQGVLPILSKSLNDVTKVRYRKQIISYINIDSRRRNTLKYPNPGNYRIFLNKEFRNLYSIRLEGLIFREPPTPINSNNNVITWITNYESLPGNNVSVEYSAVIPSAFYSLDEFVQSVEISMNNIRHEIPDLSFPNNLFPLFRFTINPFNRSIRFIQRLEELTVLTYSTNISSNIFQIRIKDQSGLGIQPFLANGPPIILSGLEFFKTNFGGIPVSLLEQKPFYSTVSTDTNYFVYDSYDAINNEFIYNLHVFTFDGSPANANQTISYPTISNNLITTNLSNYPAGHPIEVTVGRALSFVVDDECSFGKYIGLQNGSEDLYLHTNYDVETNQVVNTIPWSVMGLGQLLLDTPDYILMRIEPSYKPVGTISSNLISAIGSINYSEIEDIDNKVENNVFFAKIIFAGTSPGDVVLRAIGGDKLFYDAPLVKLVDLNISFYDSSGNLLELNQNHSFTLQMVELQEVLKDTLIDSRTGNIADIGAGIATTNPLD
jgi:hypothetical protein